MFSGDFWLADTSACEYMFHVQVGGHRCTGLVGCVVAGYLLRGHRKCMWNGVVKLVGAIRWAKRLSNWYGYGYRWYRFGSNHTNVIWTDPHHVSYDTTSSEREICEILPHSHSCLKQLAYKSDCPAKELLGSWNNHTVYVFVTRSPYY